MIHTITPAQLRLVRRQQRQRRALIQAAARLLNAIDCSVSTDDTIVQLNAGALRAVIGAAVEDGD